jgi:hypothetical protein
MRIFHSIFTASICACAIAAAASSATAAELPMQRGDAAVTQFSGTKTLPGVKSGTPADATVIDPDRPALRVLDLSKLGGKPEGQLANAPTRFSVSASEIGQVFGVALDDAAKPNIYVAATSLFGLQIVRGGGGTPVRLARGESGSKWMDGQFGPAGPGAIYRIDGATGAVTLFATIKHDGRENAGPGLGGLAFDPVSRQIFATDLETGLIHRLGLDGSDKGTFDHGLDGRPAAGQAAHAYDPARRMDRGSSAFSTEDPSTWGFADRRRKVIAVGVQGGRLYYSTAEGPQVWSVGIDSGGAFSGDPRRELEVTSGSAKSLVSSIVFDGPTRMLVAQRGEITGSYDFSTLAAAQAAVVIGYSWSEAEKAWSTTPDELPVGMSSPHRSAQGGLALGYGYDTKGSIDLGRCRATIWSTGEHLRDTRAAGNGVHGLQGSGKDLFKQQKDIHAATGSAALIQTDFPGALGSPNDPPDSTWLVDADDAGNDADTHGRVGAIAIHSPCAGADQRKPAPVPAPRSASTTAIPVPPKPGVYIYKTCFPGAIGGAVRCRITVQNIGLARLDAPVAFSDVTTMLGGPAAGGALIITSATPDAPGWACSPTPTDAFGCSLDPAGLRPGQTRHVDVLVDTGPLVAAGSTIFRNCASLSAPWSGVACDEAGAELEIEKTVVGPCIEGGACTFALTVTNTGAASYSGNVRWTDGLDIAGPAVVPITAISPALGCAPDPVQLPFSCNAPVLLAPGESLTHHITVTMPAGPAGYTARNCFAVTDPALAPANPADPFGGGPLAAAPVSACVDVDVLPAIMPVVHKKAPAAPRSCVPGLNETRTGFGACVCKPGHLRTKGQCTPVLVPRPRPVPHCTPDRNEIVSRAGHCVCAPGFVRNHLGRCVPPRRDCPHGTIGIYPHCKPIETPKCPQGTIGIYPKCKPIESPKCPEGTAGTWPECRKVEPPKCPPGTLGIFPKCRPIVVRECPAGTVGKWPICRKAETPRCPAGTTGAYPACKPIVVERCPRGTIGKWPDCKSIEAPKCPAGTIGKFPKCRKIVIDGPVKRPDLPRIDKIEPRIKVKPKLEVKKLEQPRIEKPKLAPRKLEVRRIEVKASKVETAQRPAALRLGGGKQMQLHRDKR